MENLEEKELKLKQKQSRKVFIQERVKTKPKPNNTINSNNKMNERVATILCILSELLGEWGRTGLRLHELIEKTGRTKPTLLNNLKELQDMGVVIKEKGNEKWRATGDAGNFYRDLQESFGFLDFKPVQIKVFNNKHITIDNQKILCTGSVWTNQYTKENDPNKIISSGQAGLLIIKPAGTHLKI